MGSEPVYVDGQVVGVMTVDGVFSQRINARHVWRQYNSKGIDVSLHKRLSGICRLWRLEFDQTGERLEMPFSKIAVVGREMDIKGAGRQIMVKFADFNQAVPVLQKRLV